MKTGLLSLILAGAMLGASGSNEDPIAKVTRESLANPVFGNGVQRSYDLPADAKDSVILARAYPNLAFPGKQKDYLILEERQVEIPYPARAMLIRSGQQMVVCILTFSGMGWTVCMMPQ